MTKTQRRLNAGEGTRSRKYAPQSVPTRPKGHAARAETVVLRSKSDQLRHAARDAGEEPQRQIAGTLKNRLGDGTEEQQEAKVRDQMIQINVHEKSR